MHSGTPEIGSQSCIPNCSTPTERTLWSERTERLLGVEVAFINNRIFSAPSAHRMILGKPPLASSKPLVTLNDMPSHLARLCETPLLSAEEEKDLFRRMNYAKYRFDQLRSGLNPKRPNRRKVKHAEQFLCVADQAMHLIVNSNTRLVISIIRQLNNTGSNFDDLLSDGVTSLMNAVEKFDFDRGFRFSTYATMVVKRHLFRCIKRSHRDKTRFPNGEPALLLECPQYDGGQRLNTLQWSSLTAALDNMLDRLDTREQRIIRERFGFDAQGKKRSLQSIASDFGVCKERIRQLEKRAMGKLRDWADTLQLDELLDADPLSDIDPYGSLV